MAGTSAKRIAVADWWRGLDYWLLAAFLVLLVGGVMLSFAASVTRCSWFRRRSSCSPARF